MLKIDGKEYKVFAVFPTIKNSFSIKEGGNAGTAQNGREIRDILGTAYSYSMDISPNPNFPEDFDELFHVLSAPVNSHTIEMPYGQGTITFEAAISEGERTYRGKSGGFERWAGMSLTFRPLTPQRPASGSSATETIATTRILNSAGGYTVCIGGVT